MALSDALIARQASTRQEQPRNAPSVWLEHFQRRGVPHLKVRVQSARQTPSLQHWERGHQTHVLHVEQTQTRRLEATQRLDALAMPAHLGITMKRACYASPESTRRWQDPKRVLTARLAHILHLSEPTNPRHAWNVRQIQTLYWVAPSRQPAPATPASQAPTVGPARLRLVVPPQLLLPTPSLPALLLLHWQCHFP